MILEILISYIIIITKYPYVDRYTCNWVNPDNRTFLCNKILLIFQV